jgi:hypothetical protein
VRKWDFPRVAAVVGGLRFCRAAVTHQLGQQAREQRPLVFGQTRKRRRQNLENDLAALMQQALSFGCQAQTIARPAPGRRLTRPSRSKRVVSVPNA